MRQANRGHVPGLMVGEPRAKPVASGDDVPEHQAVDAPHRPGSPRRTGPFPADDEPVGGTQQANEGPIGFELGASARDQVPLRDIVPGRFQDHASHGHGIDRQVELLVARLVDGRGGQAAETKDVAPGPGDHNPGLAPTRHDFYRAGFPIQRAPDFPCEGDRNLPREGPSAVGHQLDLALHDDLLCAGSRDAMDGRHGRDRGGRRRIVGRRATQTVEIPQAEDDPIHRSLGIEGPLVGEKRQDG